MAASEKVESDFSGCARDHMFGGMEEESHDDVPYPDLIMKEINYARIRNSEGFFKISAAER